MNFVSMSLSASLMILTILALRKILLNQVPSMIWGIMWVCVMIKLVIPYHFSTDYNIYNGICYLLNRLHLLGGKYRLFDLFSIILKLFHNKVSFSILLTIWLMGVIYIGKGFLKDFITTIRIQKMAIPMENQTEIYALLQSYGLSKKYTLCELEQIASPIACGMFQPMIIFPKDFQSTCSDIFLPALLHEYMHLKYHHTILQYFLVCIVILNWFNPFIWIFYQYVNRDMEIACDRGVLKHIGADYSEIYALQLVQLIAKSNDTQHNQLVFYNSFSKNILKERIVSIMRFKKFSVSAIAVSILLPLSLISGFGPNSNYIFGAEIEWNKYSFTIVEEQPVTSPDFIPQSNIFVTWDQLAPYTKQSKSHTTSGIQIDDYKIIHNNIYEFPDTLTITLQKEGDMDQATLYLTDIVKKGTKYIGYYSGTLSGS